MLEEKGRFGARAFARKAIPLPLLISTLVIVTTVAYLNSFRGQFLFDDKSLILEEPVRGRPATLAESLLRYGGSGSTAAGRPLVALSLMLNEKLDAIGGDPSRRDPWGYHAFNLGIHLTAGLLLFGLFRRTLLRIDTYRESATTLSFVCSLLWMVHPLQTGSVAYIAQRAESLVSLFLILSMYCLARSADAASLRRWHALSAASCFCGVLCKESGLITPILALIYDRIYFSSNFRSLFKQRKCLYLSFIVCWICGIGLILTSPRGESVAWTAGGLNPLNYALTQANAIVAYLRLVVLPDPLIIDYGWPVVPVAQAADLVVRFGTYGPSLILLLTILGIVGYGIWRNPRTGFPGVWFFFILAPSSSVVPIYTEIMAEHRMYLPLAAPILAGVLAAYEIGRYARRHWKASDTGLKVVGVSLLIAVSAALVFATDRQNRRYHSELNLWKHNLVATPKNPRVWLNIGRILATRGHYEPALVFVEKAIEASRAISIPRKPMLGFALQSAAQFNIENGKPEQADRYIREAIKELPDGLEMLLLTGNSLSDAGRPDHAIDLFRKSLENSAGLTRTRLELLRRLLTLLHARGRADEIRRELEKHPYLARGLMDRTMINDQVPKH